MWFSSRRADSATIRSRIPTGSDKGDPLNVSLSQCRLKCRIFEFVTAKAHIHRLSFIFGNDLMRSRINSCRTQFRNNVNNDIPSRRQTSDGLYVKRALESRRSRFEFPNHAAIDGFTSDRAGASNRKEGEKVAQISVPDVRIDNDSSGMACAVGSMLDGIVKTLRNCYRRETTIRTCNRAGDCIRANSRLGYDQVVGVNCLD